MRHLRSCITLVFFALLVSLAPAQASPTTDGASAERAAISVGAHAPVQIHVQRLAQVVVPPTGVETCGTNDSGLAMCYYGRTVCVAPYLVPTYQRYGATLGSCSGPCVGCFTESEDIVPTSTEKVSRLEKADRVFGLDVK